MREAWQQAEKACGRSRRLAGHMTSSVQNHRVDRKWTRLYKLEVGPY